MYRSGVKDMTDAALHALDPSDPILYATDSWRPIFQRLRTEDPVHYHERSPFGPYWSVTKFNDLLAVDQNHADFSSEPTIVIGDPEADFVIENFISMDRPRHDVQRGAVMPTVAPRNLANMENTIRSRLVPILDALPDGETFDWVERVSIELTTQMLATLFDFPFEERSKLTRWSDMSTDGEQQTGGALFPKAEREAGLLECARRFGELFQERAAQPPGQKLDFISMLAHNPHTADMPTRPMEFLGNIMLLIVGGNDTTRNTISGGVLALNQYPDQYALLRQRPDLIPNMVSEVVRWQTAVIHMRRTATRDVLLGGKQIKRGDKVDVVHLWQSRRDGD